MLLVEDGGESGAGFGGSRGLSRGRGIFFIMILSESDSTIGVEIDENQPKGLKTCFKAMLQEGAPHDVPGCGSLN